MAQTDAPSDGLIGRFDRLLIPLEDMANLIAAFAIMALMILGVLQIVLRTVFNTPITGYIDLVELSMASMAFLGAAYCQRLGSHIRMEMLVGRLRGRSLWLVEAFGAAVALFIIGVLVYYSWGHFMRAYTLGDTTIDAEFPVWPSKLLVPAAFSIWFCRLAIQLAGTLRLLINPDRSKAGVVVVKDVAEQAQDEIHEVMGDTPKSGDAS
ncbi:TRAP transporter small permease subunit [Pelagimonas varians]|uniref:TRAP transporter small permease protein n=1 Tax=Pelagimonas varians TaxID=696760 RepID=A0A238JXY0_9RHOB|nr:TRAP transporter small permease [Pelagimonas varians]PYG33034.1 TRAP-type mannitol/chloroaromatic compound transport system permease small subunit [Pelagimonas varians]SMX35505.1 Tripartite ATP-independent periplasmic transporters, DctQ component [Pelagimonas varians]